MNDGKQPGRRSPRFPKYTQSQINRMALTIAVIAGTFLVGSYALHKSRAATPWVSSEPENGTITAPATKVTDSTASGGSAVKFGSSAAGGFVHPGILVNKAQLDFVKAKIAAGQQPWTTALAQSKTTKGAYSSYNNGLPYASLSWVPNPVTEVVCTAPDSGTGCPSLQYDAIAAYSDALIYYYTGDRAYAKKSVDIMNAWSAKLTNVRWDFSGANTSPNGLLQAAWAGEIFPRAGEIMRYTYTPGTGEPSFDAARFGTMLRTAILPHVIDGDGWQGGSVNWVQSMEEAALNIAVYTDDRPTFDQMVNHWKAEVPAAIYMSGDVNRFLGSGVPIGSPGSIYDKSTTTAASIKSFWYSPNSYVSGLQGETCREPNHSAMGFGAMINTAETARIQGVDLYGAHKDRIIKGMEMNTGWDYAAIKSGTNPPAGWVCPAAMNTTNGAQAVTFEIGYNHYALRGGASMPNTQRWVESNRASGFKASGHMIDEVLTHFGTP